MVVKEKYVYRFWNYDQIFCEISENYNASV